MPVSDQEAPRDIHLLTTDALLAELIAGRSVLKGDGSLLAIEDCDARAILRWYRSNSSKWTANLNTGDSESIIDLIGTEVPNTEPSQQSLGNASGKSLNLIKLEAHRFAGLHVYGEAHIPPQRFVFEPSKAVTLFEGANGSGKTSIANALVWCLTGYLIRSQRPPEAGPIEFPCKITDDVGVSTEHSMSAITPMPFNANACPETGAPVPADTWVELTFADEEGVHLPIVRREQSRKTNGKIIETCTGLETLPVDPIALHIATTMPVLLPYVTVGSASELGSAVARLTGLASLVDLSKHSEKLSLRISKRTTKDLEKAAGEIEARYLETVSDLNAAITEYPDMKFDGEPPEIGIEEAKAELVKLTTHFGLLKSAALSSAQDVLGDSFDAENKQSRDNLEASIRPAIEQLKQLKQLPSVQRLSKLETTSDENNEIQTLFADLQSQATTLSELAANPDRARRIQLYARVAAWKNEHGHADDDHCPVCSSEMEGLKDPVTGDKVQDHLQAAEEDSETIARTIADWEEYWCGKLLNELPNKIAQEARQDLPASPKNLLKQGMIDELFATASLTGSLSALKTDASLLFNDRLGIVGDFEEPKLIELPEKISAAKKIKVLLDRVVRALAFAAWRIQNADELRKFAKILMHGLEEDCDENRAIGQRLSSLLSIVEGVAPLNSALSFVERLEISRGQYQLKKDRIEACGKVVSALALIFPLGALAQTQVDTLRNKLHKRSEYWREIIFRNATDFAPTLTGTGMDAKGVLELHVGREGIEAPAQHIANASALRGALFGFFLAFREHVLESRGGITTLILDDPQELLDNDNRDRLARGLSIVAKSKAQLLVTTHDRKFARTLVACNRSQDTIQHLSVHPVNSVCPTLKIAPSIEEVDKRRSEFRKDRDNASKAQNYASDLRVFLEARIGDLFDDTANPAYAASTQPVTLVPLIDKLRGLVSSGVGELFTNPTVVHFANDSAFAEGAEPRRILNESHHDKASITCGDVKAVEEIFAHLRTAIEKVHEQFRFYRLREPLDNSGEVESTSVEILSGIVKPEFNVPIYPDLAAFSGQAAFGGSQDVPQQILDGEWFCDKALYFIRGETLGFAIPSGSVAIVDIEPYPGRDRNLVIARYADQIFARRVVKSKGSIGITLSAQLPDPRTPRPSITFDQNLSVHRIVGAIFSDIPPPHGGSEATQVETVPELAKVELAYTVKEDSAIPLALPGQTILGGAEITAAELDEWIGRIAAITLDNGSQILKRVGQSLPGSMAHLRQFETIGGLGSSVVIATEPQASTAHLPTMVSARKIIGVLYDPV